MTAAGRSRGSRVRMLGRRLAGLRRLGRLDDDEVEALLAVARWVAREHVEPCRQPGIDPSAWISPLSSLRFAERVRIGPLAAVGPFAAVWGGPTRATASVGAQVQLGPASLVVAGNHRVDGPGPVRELGFDEADVVLGDGAWVGAGAVVIGCHVGEGAVVGANAVVVDDVPPRAVAVGAPARVLRYREGT